MRNIHITADMNSHVLVISVIQELMQTDLHRVIRTQQLTDDHCQVRAEWFASVDVPSDRHLDSTSYTKSSERSSLFTAQTSSIEI